VRKKHFHVFVLIGILTWLNTCPVSGIELHEAGTEVDTVVIDTSYSVEITPAAAPIPFTNFRYPYVDEKENVLFIGNDPFRYTPATKGNGIYRSYAADGKIESLVIQDDPAPDDGKPIGAILGLRTDFNSFVFHRGGMGTGIYGSFHGEPLVTIANTSFTAPGLGTNFKWFCYADVAGDLVVFKGNSGTESNDQEGLYLYQHSKRKVTRLLDSTQSVPAAGGEILTGFSQQPRLDNDWLVFSAEDLADGDVTKPKKIGIFGWQVKPGGNPEKMFALDQLKVLAPLGMEIPESGGRPLTYGWNVTTDGGWMAVAAGSESGGSYGAVPQWQAICMRAPDGVWRNPVDTNTLNPILNDGSFFTGFNKWVGLDEGKVIFRAYGTGYEALYIYDAVADLLYFVADTRLRIAGKSVSAFETSARPLVGKRLAMMIYFTDGTSGQYLATLPKFATKIERKSPRSGDFR
jgi:hypothetical protein